MKRKAIALFVLCAAVFNAGCSAGKSEDETTSSADETEAEQTTIDETSDDESAGGTTEATDPAEHESLHEAQRLFANDSLPEGDYLIWNVSFDDDYSGITCDVYGYYGFTVEEYETIEEGDTIILDDLAYTAHFEDADSDPWLVLNSFDGDHPEFYVYLLNDDFYIILDYYTDSLEIYLLYSDYHLSFAEDAKIWDSYVEVEDVAYGVFGHKFEDAGELDRLINEVRDYYVANVSDATPDFWNFEYNATIENGLIETLIINPIGHQDWVPSDIRANYGAYEY